MDLYEALKAGTSAEELRKTFDKDLNEAAVRIAKEKAEDDAKAKLEIHLNECRTRLIDALEDYVDAYFGENVSEDIDHAALEKAFRDFEKEMSHFCSYYKTIDKALNENTPVKKMTIIDDDDIITKFIKSL